MCKVLIQEVKNKYAPHEGETDGKAWKLYKFDCEVHMEGAQGTAVRKVKTFDAVIGESLMNGTFDPGKPFEAEKEGTERPYSFMLKSPRKTGRGGRNHAPAKTDRQIALECASLVVSGLGLVSDMPDGMSPADYTIAEAEKMEAWLKGGSK